MRPISLEMEGFTSFRERASIDFSSLDLFAITGPTGAGKTSIIDAMTYALYGCTPRMNEKQVVELISQGMSRVTVLFEFSSGKQHYRIARAGRWNGRSMTTELRFEEFDNKEWVLLADSVNKAKPIVEQIGLDFDGFTKSVVLPQGRFDEFLKGRSDERRQILSDLLNLEIYSRMMKRANQIADEHKTRGSLIEGLLKSDFAATTPENLEHVRQQLKETEPQLKPIEAELKRVSKVLPVAHGLRQARVELSKNEAEVKAIVPKRKLADDELERVRKRIEDLEGRTKLINSKLKSNAYDARLHIRLSGALDKARHLEALLAHYEGLDATRKEKAVQLSKANSDAKTLEDRAAGAKKELQAAQKDVDKDRKALTQFQEKYGSPDAIKSAIENVKRLVKHKNTFMKLETEFKACQDDLTMEDREAGKLQTRYHGSVRAASPS